MTLFPFCVNFRADNSIPTTPLNSNDPNLIHWADKLSTLTDGQTLLLSGQDAVYVKELADMGVLPLTYTIAFESVAEPNPSLLTGLLAYWTLNEPLGNRLDSTGNGHTMVQTGSITGANGFGNVGDVSVWNHSASNYLSVASTIITGGAFTVAGWFNYATFSGVAAYLFGQGTSGSSSQIAIRISNAGNLSFSVANFFHGVGILTAGTWYHVAMTYNGTTGLANLNLYLNGAFSTSADNDAAVYAGNKFALGINTSIAGPFNGDLVGWGVWNRVLPANAINTLYNSGNGQNFTAFGTLAG